MRLIILISCCVVWGFAVKSIIRNKGYEENWFWWGFFFGIIALIVALTKPEVQHHSIWNDESYQGYDKLSKINSLSSSSDEWKCKCGRVNPGYIGTCACGKSKSEILNELHTQKEIENAKRMEIKLEETKALQAKEHKQEIELKNLEILSKLKDLLDQGAISQQEYDTKKKELL